METSNEEVHKLLEAVGKHIEEHSVKLPFDLAAQVLHWYRAGACPSCEDIPGAQAVCGLCKGTGRLATPEKQRHETKPVMEAFAERVATEVVRSVCELPDYNSPEDQPDLVMCTVQELHACVVNAFEQDIYNEECGADHL